MQASNPRPAPGSTLALLLALMLAGCWEQGEGLGCYDDTDCRFGRICVDKTCVDPTPPPVDSGVDAPEDIPLDLPEDRPVDLPSDLPVDLPDLDAPGKDTMDLPVDGADIPADVPDLPPDVLDAADAADRPRTDVAVDLPDLVACREPRLIPAQVRPGELAAYQVDLCNEGIVPAGPFQLEVALEGRILAGSYIPRLLAGEELRVGGQVVVPELPAGRYELAFLIDSGDAVPEESEEDNEVRAVVEVLDELPEGIDLYVAEVAAESALALFGTELGYRVSVCNRGGQASPETVTLLYLRPEEQGPVFQLDDLEEQPLEPGQCRSTRGEVMIRADQPPAGVYSLEARVDAGDEVEELVEENNHIRAGEQIQVRGQFTSDLELSWISFEPESVEAGDWVQVDVRVVNNGPDASNQAVVSAMLAASRGLERPHYPLGEALVPALRPQDMMEVRVSGRVPVEADARLNRLAVAASVEPAEPGVDDPVPDNDRRVAQQMLEVSGGVGGCLEDPLEPNDDPLRAVRVPVEVPMDLAICGNQDWFSVPLLSGEGLVANVEYDPRPGNLNIMMRASPDAPVTVQSPGREGAASAQWALASQPGNILVGISPLPANVEVPYRLSFTVLPPEPGSDLRVLDVITPVLVPRQEMDLEATIFNAGQDPAPPFDVRIQLYTEMGEPLAELETLRLARGLDALSEEAIERHLRLPELERGRYIVGVEADSGEEVEESHEDNNRADALPFLFGATGESCEDPLPLDFVNNQAEVAGNSGQNRDDHQGACVGRGLEVVYQFRLDRAARGDFSMSADWDTGMYLKVGNCVNGQEVACNDDDWEHDRGLQSGFYGVQLQANQDYFLFADGFSNRGGPFTLTVTLQ